MPCGYCGDPVEAGAGALEGDPPTCSCPSCMSQTTLAAVIVERAMAAEGKAPYPYQRTGARWLAASAPGTGAILADGMGLGKTIQALMAVPLGSRVVVVCPSVAKSVWAAHIADYRPDIRGVRVAWKRTGRMAFGLPQTGSAVISNFELLPAWLGLVDAALQAGRPVRDACDGVAPDDIFDAALTVIVDEAHYAKNPSTARTQRTRALCAIARESGGVSWCLTGTPLKNRPPDLYTLLDVAGLTAATWPKYRDFAADLGGHREFVARGRKAYVWDGPIAATVPVTLRAVMLRREKRDVLAQLPQKSYERIVAPIDGIARKLADRAIAALSAAGVDYETASAEAVRYAATGPAFEAMSAAIAALSAAKLPTLLELLDEHEAAGEKPPLVWSRNLAPVLAVAERAGWGILTGATNPAKRGAIAADFQAGRLKGLALSFAAATAITLTAADRAFFVSRDWNPTDNEQAEDRNHRIGQFNPCMYSILVADHALDRRLDELLGEKSRTNDAVISAARVIPTAIGGIR